MKPKPQPAPQGARKGALPRAAAKDAAKKAAKQTGAAAGKGQQAEISNREAEERVAALQPELEQVANHAHAREERDAEGREAAEDLEE